MNKAISDQIRAIIRELETREKPDMIFMSREEAERIAAMLGVRLEDLNEQFKVNGTEPPKKEGF